MSAETLTKIQQIGEESDTWFGQKARNKTDLVSVLTDTDKEDMEVCFPDYSSFHLGGEVYLRAEREEITLKQGAIEMRFPLIRWKQLEYVLDDIGEAVHCPSHNRYASLKKHI